jgi:Ca2+-binding RTX toxin-like protein
LLLTFANGDHVVIPNGAIDAVGKNPPDALFSDTKISLPELFKLVGVTNPAKAGSLRLVSENIDANPPSDENISRTEYVPDTPPPPAPMLKVGAGQGTGKSLGTGLGDVPQTYTPLVTAQPSVYRVGKSQVSTNDGTSIGTPNVTSVLYTSPELKVTSPTLHPPSVGSYSATATPEQLSINASPAKQAYNEIITGTNGADTIGHNALFNGNSSEAQWVKSLHTTLNNFSSVSEIKVFFNVPSEILGFNLVGSTGVEITRDSPFGSTWTITPTTDMLTKGLDIGIVYTAQGSGSPAKDFNGVITVTGKSGAFNFEVINNLNMTWRDAVTAEDFQATNSSGTPLMVLPQRGVGVIIDAGDGNDLINAGAGNDIIIGGLGADTIDGGLGNNTASYQNASTDTVVKLTSSGLVTETNTGEAVGDTFTNIQNLTGSTENDTLIGDENKNIINGGAGNDTLIGMGGSDTLIGGDGIDTASYKYSNSVSASLNVNVNKAITAEGEDTLSGIENLTGSSGNDLLEGNSGANHLDGQTGNDTVTFVNSSAAVFASLANNAQATGDAAGDTYEAIENLTGSAFNDTLEGSSSANKFDGDLGNDTVTYQNSTTGVTASLVNTSINTSDALGDTYTSIENLTGSAFNDKLEGNASANKFDGGAGEDTVTYQNALAITGSIGIYASLIAPTNNTGYASGDTFTNIENLTGSAFNDTLEGNSGANKFDGGLGNNTVTYALSSAGITSSLANNNVNLGDALGDTYTRIQNIIGSAFDDFLYGDINSNNINGGAGDDTIQGNGSGDILDGGTGVDTLIWTQWATTYGVAFDMVSGLFTVQNVLYSRAYNFENFTNDASLISDVTLSNVDNIYIGSTVTGKDTAIYTYAASSVQANIGTSPWINGSVTLQGQKATGGSGNDTLINIDNLDGSNYSDTLIGNSDNNVFQGNGGADIIDGLSGTDTATYINSNAAVTITFANANNATGAGGHAAGDVLTNIERIIGSKNFGDTFIVNANALPTSIDGNERADTIKLSGLTSQTYATLFNSVAAKSTNNETLDIKDLFNSTINITYLDVQSFVDQGTNSTLQINANNGDVINLTDGATFFDNDTNGLTSLTQAQANGIYYISNGSSTVATINWQHS